MPNISPCVSKCYTHNLYRSLSRASLRTASIFFWLNGPSRLAMPPNFPMFATDFELLASRLSFRKRSPAILSIVGIIVVRGVEIIDCTRSYDHRIYAIARTSHSLPSPLRSPSFRVWEQTLCHCRAIVSLSCQSQSCQRSVAAIW